MAVPMDSGLTAEQKEQLEITQVRHLFAVVLKKRD
jgi:hypothetical protein